jgi:hypothetical protein
MDVFPGIVRFKDLTLNFLLMRACLMYPIFPSGCRALQKVYRRGVLSLKARNL